MYDPAASRQHHRISAVYELHAAIEMVEERFDASGEPIYKHLRLDRLSPALQASYMQFPHVLSHQPVENIKFANATSAAESASIWVVRLASNVMLAALTVDVSCDRLELIQVLEDLHHRRATVDGLTILETIHKLLPDTWTDIITGLGLETYNLVHLDERFRDELRPSGQLDIQFISSLIYRFEDIYPQLSDRIRLPPESNRGSAFAATGPYVGVTVSNQGYVENAIFISVLLFVGALATLRTVRNDAYKELIRARTYLAARRDLRPRATRQQRVLMSVSAQRLARLELDLSAGVEAFARIASTVPSLRVTDFHEDLFDSASIADEVRTVGAILQRLSAALRAETERRHAAERREDERRTLVRAVAFGVITTIALPLGIVFGFFGVNGTEIHADAPITSLSVYRTFYLLLGGVFLLSVSIGFILQAKFIIERRAERRQIDEAMRL